VTSPGFDLEMLRVLMTLPVVLAAENFGTVMKSAAIGLRMSLFVLPAKRSAASSKKLSLGGKRTSCRNVSSRF